MCLGARVVCIQAVAGERPARGVSVLAGLRNWINDVARANQDAHREKDPRPSGTNAVADRLELPILTDGALEALRRGS